MDFDRGRLDVDGVPVVVRAKVFDLLAFLFRHPGRVLSKNEIIAGVWGRAVVTDDALTQTIREARVALDDRDARVIKTVPKRGYLVEAPAPADEPDRATNALQFPDRPSIAVLALSARFARLPHLNALRAFEASARRLSFTAAAIELGVTQGAVAQHVRGLEADLGIKLFERLPRALALTDEGRRYAARLQQAFELIADATAELRPEPLRLTISVTPTFAAKWLVPRLPVFNEEHSEIELRIVASDVLSNFQSDGVDIAVRQGRPPFGPGLLAELLVEQELVAVCHPRLLGNNTFLTPEHLGQLTLLHDAHDLWPEFMGRALKLESRPHARRISFNHTALAVDAAIAGQGVALVSRFLVADNLATGRLALAFAPSMRGSADYYLVRPREPRQPKLCEIVWAWLISRAPKKERPA